MLPCLWHVGFVVVSVLGIHKKMVPVLIPVIHILNRPSMWPCCRSLVQCLNYRVVVSFHIGLQQAPFLWAKNIRSTSKIYWLHN